MRKRKLSFIGACVLALTVTGCSGVKTLEKSPLKAVSNGDSFSRVSSVDNLSDGDEIIFVNQDETYACGTTQNTNNRTPVPVTVSNHKYTYNSTHNVQVFTVKITANGKYGFHSGSGYLYSASGSKNNLSTNSGDLDTDPTGTATWNVSVSDNVFSVTNVTNTSYYLAFNGTSYFSQYKQGQSKPFIFKKGTGSSQQEQKFKVTYNANGATGDVPVDNNEYKSGDPVTVLGKGNLEKTNYTFGGWKLGNVTLNPGQTFNITADETLIAVWNYSNQYTDNTENSTITWDLTNPEYVSASDNQISWTSPKATMTADKASSSTKTNNYCPPDHAETRFYKDSTLTISPVDGYQINRIVFTSASSSAATELKNSSYENASATSSGATVTIVPTNKKQSIVITIGASTGQYTAVVHYAIASNTPSVELDKDSLSFKTNDTVGKTVKATVDNVEDPHFNWSTDDNNIVLSNTDTDTVTVNVAPNLTEGGDARVNLTVTGVTPNLTAYFDVTITIPDPGETAGTAFTVAEARNHVDSVISGQIAEDGNDGNYYYAKGIVSEIVYSLSNGQITYNFSSDGLTTSDQLQAYRGKNAGPSNFTNEDDVTVGDQVIVYGKLKKYNSTYEFDANNQLVSRVAAPSVNSISLTPSSITVEPISYGNVVDLFTNIVIDQDAGLNYDVNDIEWSSDDNTIFLIDNGEYMSCNTHRATTTIKASINGKVYGSATVTIIDPTIRNIGFDNDYSWTKITSIKSGIKVAFVYEENETKKELTSVTTSGTTIGQVTDYNSNPSGSYILEVVSGKNDGSFAFKTSSGNYLSWSDGNSLATSSSVSESSSWTIDPNHDGTDGNWKFVNVGTTTRILQYNSGQPRFACYGNDNQKAFQIYQRRGGQGDIDLPSVESVATIHGTEVGEPGSITVTDAKLRFGMKISEADWNAFDAAVGIDSYGVMLFRCAAENINKVKTVEEYYSLDASNVTDINKVNNNDQTFVNGYYDFQVQISINTVANYSRYYCVAPYIVAGGHYYFFDEIQESVNTLAEKILNANMNNNTTYEFLSDEALLYLATTK